MGCVTSAQGSAQHAMVYSGHKILNHAVRATGAAAGIQPDWRQLGTYPRLCHSYPHCEGEAPST